MSTTVCVIGTVATVPKLVTPASGIAFCSFRIASNDRRFDREKNQWVQGDTNWMTVNLFRSLAEHAKQSFAKGDRIIVNGRLRIRDWTNDERRGTSTEIDADGVGHDLRWGTSAFTKQRALEALPETLDERDEAGAPAEAPAEPGTTQHGWNDTGGITDRATDPDPGSEPERMSDDGFTPQAAAA